MSSSLQTFVAIVTDQVPYDRTILFLHKSLIVSLVSPGPSERDLFLPAVLERLVVDELATVVRVQTQQRKGQSLGDGVERADHVRLASSQQGYTLGPAGSDIHQD